MLIKLVLEEKVPFPFVLHMPGLFDVAVKLKVAFEHKDVSELTLAVAGGKMVSVPLALTAGQGPVPSGSVVVQVSVILCALLEFGVKVVALLLTFANVPEPAGALQVPVPLEVELIGISELPQVVKGPNTEAVAAVFTVKVTRFDVADSQPLPFEDAVT